MVLIESLKQNKTKQKNTHCNAGDPGLLPGREDPLEKG